MDLQTVGQWETDTDVAICGGGFAGLLLARQLRRDHPEVSVTVIDRLARPLPDGAFKVGESTVELAAYYMRDMLGLADYLDRAHLRKLGLRFFFPAPEGSDGSLASRPETGLANFASVPAHQIDRGRLEHDLRGIIEADGATLIEGARIRRIAVAEGDAPHEVTFQKDGQAPQTISARWVVDATGRKLTLQRQLGLTRRREADHNAVWFRVAGELRIDDMVPADNAAWHDRVPEGRRWYSTNHLVGQGYWVWIIPLSTGKTSIGLVADQTYHPLETFQTRDKAMEWLQAHEPEFAAHLKGYEMLDFAAMKNYSHSSSRVFSADRWACTGDAGVFADPMYSPGTDLIAFANCCISWMVGEDSAGRLTPEKVEEKNRFLISLSELLTRSIQVNYHLLGCSQAMGAKLFWDITAGWAVVQPLLFGNYFLDGEKHAAVRGVSKNFFFMSLQMNQMFLDWCKQTKGHIGYDFIDYLEVDAIREMRARNLIPNKPLDALIRDQQMNIELLEDLALVLFRLAVADCIPEQAHRIEGRWLTPSAITLDHTKWEERGLFEPKSPPRDLSYLSDTLFAMFNVPKVKVAA